MKKLNVLSLVLVGSVACIDLSGPEYNKPKIPDRGVDKYLDSLTLSYFVYPIDTTIEKKAAAFKHNDTTYWTVKTPCHCQLPKSQQELIKQYNSIFGGSNK